MERNYERNNNLGAMVNRGQIWFAKLEGGVGSQQSGERPVLIVQNDMGNKYSPVCTVIPMTSQPKKHMPTHVVLFPSEGVNKRSIVMAEQIMTISKSQIVASGYIGTVPENKMAQVENAIKIQCGMQKVVKQNMGEIINNIKQLKEDINGYEEDMIRYNKTRHFNALVLAIKELKMYCIDKGVNSSEYMEDRYYKFLEMNENNKKRKTI